MGSIYIENYLKISKNDKMDFFILINQFTNFQVSHKKIILDENSILLEFSKNSDINFANELFEKFFEDIELNHFKINIMQVKEITQNKDELILTYKNDLTKKIVL